jgi:mRNA interferase MazF
LVGRPTAPDRADLVWLSFDPRLGHEQAGRRPALVLSPVGYNGRVGLALCCPVTSRAKGYPWEVPLPDGLAVRGVVLSDQIHSFDWRARRAVVAGRATDAVVAEVVARLLALLPEPLG